MGYIYEDVEERKEIIFENLEAESEPEEKDKKSKDP